MTLNHSDPLYRIPPVRPVATRWLGVFLLAATKGLALANPQGMAVAQGAVSAVQNGAHLDITASHNAVINWQSFNIGAGETTTFHQPSAVSVVWNRITDQNPAQIWGSLQANGIVVLMNQSGFYFGPGSSINVGGFIAASTPALPSGSPGAGGWQYNGPPPVASIINYGEIKAASGGSLFMIAEKIENHGILSAPDGTLGLYAGKEVLISDRPDGRGLSVRVNLPEGSIDNTGKICADAGNIALHARAVNQNGLIQANSVRENNGRIELVASDQINLGSQSLIQANGDAAGISSGGIVTIKSASAFSDAAGSRIEARGGDAGGDGGQVEICALNLTALNSATDGSAQPGWAGGRLLFDPYDINLVASNGDTASSGTVNSSDQPGATMSLNANSAFTGFSQILLQATHNINLAAGLLWTLPASTPGSLLTLQAGQDIVFNNNARIQAGNNWSVSLQAGVDFTLPIPAVQPGVGGIYLNGGPTSASGVKLNFSGAIQADNGIISLQAGREVLVGSGYIRTVNGGGINVTALSGDVDAGTKSDTFDYTRFGYAVAAAGLGGIGTANGGDVSIHAGRDILALQASIGAFGSAAGNLDLNAGRDIRGRFMERNGVGSLSAGRDVGSVGSGASFGLIRGGWNVSAARDLYVNEVYNPNGSLNINRVAFGSFIPYQFDYAPDAFANFTGGNSVQLLGNSIARTSGNPDRPLIFAPCLGLTAGAGGVVLANNIILYPSALGGLQIRTTDGGSFRSSGSGFYQMIVSDSDSPDYHTFASRHAATPVHNGGDGAGIELDVSGDVKNLSLRFPEAADIRIHGNAVNVAFEGQNLSGADTTRFLVDGDYFSRVDRTFVVPSSPVDMGVFTGLGAADAALLFQNGVTSALGSRLTYDPATGRLGIQGVLTPAELQYLLHPVVYVVDPVTRRPMLGDNGLPMTEPATFTTDTAALQQLYTATQDIPTSGLARNGLQIGGPGRFEFHANNLELGISQGIRSVGTLLNPNLASVSLASASLNVSLAGNLEMTSSQIASFNGGSIAITAGGYMNVGSQDSYTSDNTPKGIYTAHGGSVSVQAAGDVSIDGSRIASYDGGDVSVVSTSGNVDAGAGAKGFFGVTTSQWNPLTGQLELRTDRFFGSGIMALTRTDGDAQVGNISIHAGGDILANSGGVLQLAFNNADQSGAMVNLDAGGSIRASHSGVLGRNVALAAGGSIEGLVVAAENVSISAQQNVTVTALAGGSASVSAGESVTGTIVGGGNVSVAGSSVSASVISTGGSTATSGDASGAATGAFNGVSSSTAQKSTDSADKTLAANDSTTLQEDEKKKRDAGSGPVLARPVGRVTVILPNKS
jgi:filamentous hemagglutinin family protein